MSAYPFIEAERAEQHGNVAKTCQLLGVSRSAVDHLKRAFGPGTVELDRVYVGDITYIWTWQGRAYLATLANVERSLTNYESTS